jgi:hypothetical protein
MKKISSKSEYRKLLSNHSEALKRAEKVRDIELDLYWRRAAYFWAFSAAAFAGYFALSTASDSKPDLLIYVSCLGSVFSYVWYLANRGGKFWQVSWEHHIDLLEDNGRGPLYKTILVIPRKKMLNPIAPYPFSVSKLNQWLSLFVSIVWLVLVVRSASINKVGLKGKFTLNGFVLILTILFYVVVTIFSERSRPRKDRSFEMESREYKD